MPIATVTTKGRITLPREVRRYLRVEAGDKVGFVIGDDGRVEVRSVAGSVRSLFGCLRRPGGRRVGVRAMDRAVLDHVAREAARIRRRGR